MAMVIAFIDGWRIVVVVVVWVSWEGPFTVKMADLGGGTSRRTTTITGVSTSFPFFIKLNYKKSYVMDDGIRYFLNKIYYFTSCLM